MKNSFFTLLIILLLPLICFSQNISNIEYISPFNEGLAAVKKDNKWGFINIEGDLIINFRDDLETLNFKDDNYPAFENNRCLISIVKEGITYFGYIDKTGATVIEPQFLNATRFNNDMALAIQFTKDTIGFNNILNKPVVKHDYFEVLINKVGETLVYLTPKPRRIVLSEEFLKELPKINSKILTQNLVAVMNENRTWEIKKVVHSN
jgi:hypothetical protein